MLDRIFPVFNPNAGKCGENADQNNSEYGHSLGSVRGSKWLRFIYSSVTHFNGKFTVFLQENFYIFWCAWESTSKNLIKSQLEIGISTLNIIQL